MNMPSATKVSIEDKIIESTGMVEGKHHTFSCSKCRAPLADVMVNYPDVDVEWNITAKCGHCGDKSYQQKVYGMFLIGRNEETEKYSRVCDVIDNGNSIVIETIKVKEFK
jgi:hypothetical protein